MSYYTKTFLVLIFVYSLCLPLPPTDDTLKLANDFNSFFI